MNTSVKQRDAQHGMNDCKVKIIVDNKLYSVHQWIIVVVSLQVHICCTMKYLLQIKEIKGNELVELI